MKNWSKIVLEEDIPKNETFLGIIDLMEMMPEHIHLLNKPGNTSFNIKANHVKDLTKYLERQGYKQHQSSGSSHSSDSTILTKNKSSISITLNDSQDNATVSVEK